LYSNPTEVDYDAHVASATERSCPYKGKTSGYWSVRTSVAEYPDIAWAYDFFTQ
jgi:uncharacterized protein (DUF427 family)